MKQLAKQDLFSLEEYSTLRSKFRADVMAHKKNRRVAIGEHAALYFEDALTVQYQVQEMLRIEKIFEADGIQDELDVYNPLVPDGSNWKATFMMEYGDAEQRKVELTKLVGIEDKIWVKVGENKSVSPIANEDLPRSTEEKTSAVHFMRFELTDSMVNDVKQGASITFGISHDNYQAENECLSRVSSALLKDLS
jgi:hypothetical protein